MSRSAITRPPQNKISPIEDFKPSSPHELKKTIFSLQARFAKSVKLAADFTDWDKSPLEMSQAENGAWSVVVPLAAGNYSYRFIVDGQWCDDPQCSYRIPNPFGTANDTIKVA